MLYDELSKVLSLKLNAVAECRHPSVEIGMVCICPVAGADHCSWLLTMHRKRSYAISMSKVQGDTRV